MLKYALHRLLEMVPTTMAILLVTFFLFTSVGDSPALIVLGKNASAEKHMSQPSADRPRSPRRDAY